MGLLSKIKSALGLAGASAQGSDAQPRPAQGRASQGGRKPRDGKTKGGAAKGGAPKGDAPRAEGRGPTRSRSAKPRGPKPEGEPQAVGGAAPVSEASERSPRRDDRPRRVEGDRERRRSRGGRGRGGSRGGDRDVRRDRSERGPRDTPAGMERPGGAFTQEQLKAYAEAHAAWDPASYVVPEEEGKKRFADFGLPNEILHAVADLGFRYCTPIQAQSLEFSLAGKNVAGRAQTGTGKTAAFLIAVLTRYLRTPEKRNLQPGCPRALILAPTRELVIQICKDAEALGKYCGDVRSLAVYGGMDYDRQRRELEDAPVDLLVATPGRLKDYMRSRIVDLRQVDTLVIDEADRMLDMGFIPDVRAIVNRLPDRDHRCTMLYSATLNDTVMNLAAMWMRDPVRVEIEAESLATDTVNQVVYIARAEEKFRLLYNHLAKYPDARTIVFCNRKFTTERISENLRRRGIACEVLSGDVNQVRRLKILEAFRAGDVRTVVATDVAGRGIHVDDIAFVVNYDFPYEPEDYVHRIGRTGRAGHTGTAISFADEDESFIIPDIEKYINEPLKCTMPEEWMYAELPAPAPRGRKRDRRPEEPSRPAAVEQRGASETQPCPVPAEVERVSSGEVSTTVPAVATAQQAEVSPQSESPAEAGGKPQPKAVKAVRPEREPRFRPHGGQQDASCRQEEGHIRGPRREKPVAQRWARTQADGPRDGSESHHAAPITARPIYAPGRRGPVSAEWSPGQGES